METEDFPTIWATCEVCGRECLIFAWQQFGDGHTCLLCSDPPPEIARAEMILLNGAIGSGKTILYQKQIAAAREAGLSIADTEVVIQS